MDAEQAWYAREHLAVLTEEQRDAIERVATTTFAAMQHGKWLVVVYVADIDTILTTLHDLVPHDDEQP